MNKRIRKKHAKSAWLALQQQLSEQVAAHPPLGLFDAQGIPVVGWQKNALWIGGKGQEREARS